MLDLGFGRCRMCVCGPAEAAELLKHHERIRVATKYPKIAKDYFYNRKHQTVEIIKLNGSIELAPIVGLSEVIVDIVETGSTLRENGLGVLEEVCPLSARMVVNPVSMKMENATDPGAHRQTAGGCVIVLFMLSYKSIIRIGIFKVIMGKEYTNENCGN